MKIKISAFLAAFFSFLIPLVSCGREGNAAEKISQIRRDILRGETEDFLLTAFCERRESPFLEDGEAGNASDCLIFTLTDKAEGEFRGQPALKFSVEKEEYLVRFPPDLLSPTRRAEVRVKTLPEGRLTCELSFAEERRTVELLSVRKAGTAAPEEAVKVLLSSGNDRAKEFLSLPRSEIRVRLLEHGGFLYYYAGVVAADEDGRISAVSFLLDGETLEVLAVREEERKKSNEGE